MRHLQDTCYLFYWEFFSLRKQPFLLALRRWGRFAQRNICDSATEIPYWWCKSIISGSHRVPNPNLFNFTLLLVDFAKVLSSSAIKPQQNSNTSSREEFKSTNIGCFVRDWLRLHLTFVAFCLSSVIWNNSWNNVTSPLANQRFWPDSGQILCHQYGISVAESQTLFLAKSPQWRRARRNGCFHRLRIL